jgi:Werner syndrome ATP-dependent helicase
MATGYGKSLCFQFPAIYLQELTICISPLISLMKDQVMKLNDMGIEAALLGSAATKKAATLKRYLKLGNCIKFFLRINLKYFGLLI